MLKDKAGKQQIKKEKENEGKIFSYITLKLNEVY